MRSMTSRLSFSMTRLAIRSMSSSEIVAEASARSGRVSVEGSTTAIAGWLAGNSTRASSIVLAGADSTSGLAGLGIGISAGASSTSSTRATVPDSSITEGPGDSIGALGSQISTTMLRESGAMSPYLAAPNPPSGVSKPKGSDSSIVSSGTTGSGALGAGSTRVLTKGSANEGTSATGSGTETSSRSTSSKSTPNAIGAAISSGSGS